MGFIVTEFLHLQHHYYKIWVTNRFKQFRMLGVGQFHMCLGVVGGCSLVWCVVELGWECLR